MELLCIMLKTIENYGKMYSCPFLLQFDDENQMHPYRVEVAGNGHYFATEREALEYIEAARAEYFRLNPRRTKVY